MYDTIMTLHGVCFSGNAIFGIDAVDGMFTIREYGWDDLALHVLGLLTVRSYDDCNIWLQYFVRFV